LVLKFVLPALNASALLIVMGAGLVLTGFLLTSQHKNKWRSADSATWKDGVLTGLLQGLAALPGVSRAGTSTTGLIWRGFDAESSFHLSFLLSIPTVFLTEVVFWIWQGGVSALPVLDGLLLAAASFVFGYFTIGALIRAAHKLNVDYLAFAFGLMMIRLDGCLTCHADSYRAMRGCTTCAQQTIARFKGSDEELLQRFEWARRDVLCYLAEGRVAAD